MAIDKINIDPAEGAAGLEWALKVRKRLASSGVLMVNLIGSAGSGRTELLEKTLESLNLRAAVILGGQAAKDDCLRVGSLGVPCAPVASESGCLTAQEVFRSLEQLPAEDLDLVFVENIGGLTCPAAVDLGEDHKAAVTSVSQGGGIPGKYPKLFALASATVLTKIDLIPYVDFDEIGYWDSVTRLNPQGRRLRTSCVTGQGLNFWIAMLQQWVELKRAGGRKW